MGVKYIKRNGKTITIDTETGKELKFGDRLKNKIRKGVINFSNKPFGLDYAKYKGTDVWDDKKKRFLYQNELDKKNKNEKEKLKINKNKKPYAKDRVGYVDKNSKEYKAAVKMTNKNKVVNKKEEKKNTNNKIDTKTAFNQKGSLLDKKNEEKTGKTTEKKKSKFIKRKNGTLAKRGSVTARRAENREAARKRAQAAAKLRIQKKKEKK